MSKQPTIQEHEMNCKQVATVIRDANALLTVAYRPTQPHPGQCHRGAGEADQRTSGRSRLTEIVEQDDTTHEFR